MPQVELSAGTVEYEDTGGHGPVLVLLHGLLQDGTLWRHVVADLRAGHRCVVPTLPLGGHRHPMRPDAALTTRGIARLVGELLERLDLRDVTLVLNDWGGAQLLVLDDRPGGAPEGPAGRVARLVLTPCEAFDNVPPGLTGRTVAAAARIPGGLALALSQLRIRPLRRLPLAWGWLSKRPVPDAVMDAWLRPATTQREIRRDLRKYLLDAPQARRDLVDAARRLPAFDRPVLVAWAAEDRVMPPEHGRRLAAALPKARLVEIADSYTLIPEDQPGELARLLREFVAAT